MGHSPHEDPLPIASLTWDSSTQTVNPLLVHITTDVKLPGQCIEHVTEVGEKVGLLVGLPVGPVVGSFVRSRMGFTDGFRLGVDVGDVSLG